MDSMQHIIPDMVINVPKCSITFVYNNCTLWLFLPQSTPAPPSSPTSTPHTHPHSTSTNSMIQLALTSEIEVCFIPYIEQQSRKSGWAPPQYDRWWCRRRRCFYCCCCCRVSVLVGLNSEQSSSLHGSYQQLWQCNALYKCNAMSGASLSLRTGKVDLVREGGLKRIKGSH